MDPVRIPSRIDLEQVKRVVDNLVEALDDRTCCGIYARRDHPDDDVLTLMTDQRDADLILGTADTAEDIYLLGKWLRNLVAVANDE